MRVIADTSPLRYLVLVDYPAILPALFGRVLIPSAVAAELQRPRTPASVRAWIASSPPWLETRRPRQPLVTPTLLLGPGEQEAITLAQDLHADLVLMDDMEGREEAEHHGLAVMGTLRVLELAAERDLIDFPTAITKLQATSFYLPVSLVREMLARDAARKSRPPT
jgi:predicted nucleic acid-binding protein